MLLPNKTNKVNQEISTGKSIQSSLNLNDSLETIPSGVVITDKDGRPINFNRLAIELLGEIPAKTNPAAWPRIFSLFQKDFKTPYPENGFPLLRALKGENVIAEEMARINRVTHEVKWLSMAAKPMTSSDGKVTGAMLFLNDITGIKQVELSYQRKIKQIEASYELQQRISEISNDPLRILNLVVDFAVDNSGDGCFAALLNIPVNKIRVVAFHHKKPTARKLLYNSLVSQEFGLVEVIEKVIQSGDPLLVPSVDQTHLSKVSLPNFDKYVNVIGVQSILVVPIKGRNRILGTLGLFRDRGGNPYTSEDQNFMIDLAYRTGLAIDSNYLVNLLRVESSGRRSAEAALELSEARFQSIFTSTALGIKLLDLDGNILETNPAFERMLGYSEDEFRGSSLSAYWHPADAKYLSQVLEKIKSNKVQSYQLEHRLIRKDRYTLWANATFTGIRKNDREESLAFIVAIAEDISERKRIEAEMTRMKSRLQSHVEFERLRLAQELHDGPLQDLYSAIYKIEGWGNQTEPEYLDRLNALKQDLLNVVVGLRGTAKDLRPPALADFGLEKAIRSHAEEFHESHPDIHIELNLAHDGKLLPEDIRLILFRIYQHSIANILRHAEACDIFVDFKFDAEEASLEIRDNGTGFVVPTNWMELVRQGHYGLAGAVERVSLLDGEFLVDSNPGEGTTVRVVIPITNGNETNVDTREED